MRSVISKYLGNLRVKSTHLQSGSKILTDAPTDNHGKGEAFSPTDLVATALGNCMLTMLGFKAKQMNLDVSETTIEIDKVMSTNPRRVGKIIVDVKIKDKGFSDKDKKILEASVHTCPVAKSLHPDIKQAVTFSWT